MNIDIVVAVCNEAQVIPEFVQSVQALSVPSNIALSMVFVEDSSTDETVEVLKRLAVECPAVRFFSLEKGFGQPAALWFGMSNSDADAIITMDVDQGHPVSLIPELIQRRLAGAEIVQAVRRDIGGRAAYRDIGTRLFEMVAGLLTGVDMPRQNVHFRLVSRSINQRILRQRRWIYFLRLNFRSPRPKTEYVEFESQERTVGESKYGFGRLLVHSVYGVLSLITPARFWCLLATLGGIAALGCVWFGWWFVVVALVGVGVLLVRYLSMCHNRISERMRVREQG